MAGESSDIQKNADHQSGLIFPKGLDSEKGSVTAFFMLASILIIYAADKFWEQLFNGFPFISQFAIGGLLFCFVLYSLLTGIYTVVSGEASPGQLKKTVLKESKKLDKLLKEAGTAVHELEHQLRVVSGIMHPEGFKELRKVKAILASLESRSKKAKTLIKSRDADKIIAGYNIFFSDIGDYEDANMGLILDDNLPECSYDKIPDELKRRIAIVEKTLPVKSNFAR